MSLLKNALTLFCAVCIFIPAQAAFNANLDIFDQPTLQKIDRPGILSFATLLGHAQDEKDFLNKSSENSQIKQLRLLRLSELNNLKDQKYEVLTATIKKDIEEIKANSGVKMAYSAEQAETLAPAGNVARHFDHFWLSSKMAGFPLVGIVNRLDKMSTNQGTCGEVRFIYRLSYFRESKDAAGQALYSHSTLPLFLNMVYTPKLADCQKYANTWVTDSSNSKDSLDQLLSGPLSLANLDFKQLELNMQIVRLPSGLKTDFGGQAIYLFRIFKERQGQWISIPLENTIDVQAVKNSKELRQKLIDQLLNGENQKAIDQGTLVLENSDQKLLATRALSFSTSGRMRYSNKPFTAVLGIEPDFFKSINFNELKFVKSSRGMVERLNNMTCIGCHQNGGTAGFHILGMGGVLNSSFNQVNVPFSSHYYAERTRRAEFLRAVSQGETPSVFVPLSFYPPGKWSPNQLPGQFKAFARDLCLPGNQDFSLPITCGANSSCVATVVNSDSGVAIGECVNNKNSVAGHVCRKGVITTAKDNVGALDLFNLKSFKDSVNVNQVISDSGTACGNPSGGVPLGRISKLCDAESKEGRLEFVDSLIDGKSPPNEICAMRGGPQFDECAKAPNPPQCLANAKIVRALLDTCYVGQFCREDYICQQLPIEISKLYQGQVRTQVANRIQTLASRGIGFCVPNYFVFNMRGDGHLIPEGRKGM